MGAGCLSRRAYTRDRLSFGRLEGGWFCRALARAPAIPDAAANRAADCAHRNAHIALRKSGCAPAKQLEAPARVLEHRARGLSARWRGVFRWSRGDVLPGRVSAHDAVKFLCSCNRGTANGRGNFGFRWIGPAFAVPRLRHVDCDGVARRRSANRGIFRKVFYLLRRDRAAPNSARRGWRDHSGLWVLLLSESCPRDVLAARCQGRQYPRKRFIPARHERADRCNYLAGNLSGADFRGVKTLKEFQGLKCYKGARRFNFVTFVTRLTAKSR